MDRSSKVRGLTPRTALRLVEENRRLREQVDALELQRSWLMEEVLELCASVIRNDRSQTEMIPGTNLVRRHTPKAIARWTLRNIDRTLHGLTGDSGVAQ